MAKKLSKNTSIAQVKSLKNNVTRKFAKGGPGKPPATFQDSLNVANSAQQVADWYRSQGYYGGVDVGGEVPAQARRGVKMIDTNKITGGTEMPKGNVTLGGRTSIGTDDSGKGGITLDLPEYKFETPSFNVGEGAKTLLAHTLNGIGQIQNMTNENLPEWESDYTFRQYADNHKKIQNTDAPKALYDTRIHPRSTFNLQGTAPGYFSGNADIVDMPLYEKFYTAPWSVLSDADKRKRLEFGILDGTPFKDWNDERLIQQYPDLAIARGGRRQYDAETVKNAAASGYAPTQEGAAQYERNKWGKNPRVYDAQTIANAAKSGYPATQSGAAEYELNGWGKSPNSKNSIARKEPNPNTDIAHYMKTELGLDKKQTSYSERKKLAEKYGIKEYSGSAKQNIELLNKIKSEEDPADAVRRMLAGEKLNTALPTDSQPEDFKVPYKGDPNRRSYPIELSGDAAIDNMRQQLFGNLGKFTDNGKIPLDDPKYNPYVGGIGPKTPQKEMQRIAIPPGGFATGGFNYNGGPGRPNNPLLASPDVATAADSALVAGQANQVLNFYKNNPTYETAKYTIPFKTPPTPAYFAEKLNSAKESYIERLKEADPYMAVTGHVDRNGKVTFSSIPKLEEYYKDLGDNKFLQKEITNGAFNMDAPMALYDSRIDPQKLTLFDLKPEFEKDFSFPDENGNNRIETMGDHVEVLTYDPLATTPWNQLSKTDKIKRLKDFGESGSPYKSAKEGIDQLTRKNPNEQTVVFNTDKGDIYKVQDIKTKRLIRYEDANGNTIDINNPNGTPANEFYDRGENAQPNANPGKEMKIIKTPKFAEGGFNEDGKWKDKYKSKDGNYLTKTKGEYAIQTDSSTRRTLKGFVTGAPKPNEIPVRNANAKFKTGGENYTKNMLNANSTTGPRSEQSWQDPGVDRFSGNTNGVKAAYYLKKGGLKSKVSSKFNKLKK